jgi:hypothetical protein
LERAIKRLRPKPPSAKKPLPSRSIEDGSGAVTGAPFTEPPVSTPAVGASGFVKSAKRLPDRSAGPGAIIKEPARNVAKSSLELREKICGPKNIQRKSSPSENTVSRSNNPPPALGAKLIEAGAVNPADVGEENVTLIPVKSTKPPDPVEDEKSPDTVEGTVKTKVNVDPGSDTEVAGTSDPYVLFTV